MAAFNFEYDSTATTWANADYTQTTWYTTNTCFFAEQPRLVTSAWKDYRDRDRKTLALAGAGHRRDSRTTGPRRYLTTAARAPRVSARLPLRGAREFAYKRPRKAGLIPT